MDHRFSGLGQCLGKELWEKVSQCKLLVVGAGGIGCELLKNLVLSGFKNIDIVDMDTIDLSNLNRQFLFQRQHVGMSKAEVQRVARKSALRFNSNVNITARHANIKGTDFGPQFIKEFDLVLNALDNLDARRHVNRLCIATDTPLIESGTAGYLGQVQVIKKGVFECYECHPKPTPKQYAFCTIRSAPTKPIHCIIWAKEELSTYFGDPSNIVNYDDEESDDSVILEEEKKLELLKAKNYAEYMFFKLFHFSIFKKVRVGQITGKDKEIWAGRAPPVPLTVEAALKVTTTTTKTDSGLPEQRVLTVKEYTEMFLRSAKTLNERKKTSWVEWDKDDIDCLEFVTAAANLRSHIFNIELQSQFTIKSLAGNIIPAIATTNAIVAGMIVMEAFKVLANKLEDCRSIFVSKLPSRDRILIPQFPEKPQKACFVCGANFLTLNVNTEICTLDDLVNKVLRAKVGFNEPLIMLNSNILVECGEGLDDVEIANMKKQLTKTLKQVNITDNVIIEVEDNSQALHLQISITHKKDFAVPEQIFELIGNIEKSNIELEKPTEQPPPTTTTTTTTQAMETTVADEDDIEIITKEEFVQKRKRNNDEDPSAKREKSETKSERVIELD